eukprot:8170890-Pyramimonas_sp.AAC.1
MNGRFMAEQLSTHATRNIRRMYDTLHMFTCEHWGVDDTPYEVVRVALADIIKAPRGVQRGQSVVVQLFLHQDLESLGINTIVADDEHWDALVPKATRDCLERPVLAYKCAPPLSRSFCNYRKSASIPITGVQNILDMP